MQGYIHHSSNASDTGTITCCTGCSNVVEWDFSFADCDTALRTRLQGTNVTGVKKGKCPPPTGVIKVRFDRKTSNGENVADNVRAT